MESSPLGGDFTQTVNTPTTRDRVNGLFPGFGSVGSHGAVVWVVWIVRYSVWRRGRCRCVMFGCGVGIVIVFLVLLLVLVFLVRPVRSA